MNDWGAALDAYIDEHAARWREVRRHLHAHPELSGEELHTTEYLARQLGDIGLDYRIPDSRRGIIADGPREGHASRVALRADIDALPLHDEKEVPYRSTRIGNAHACGHDAHAAMLLGAVTALHRCRAALPWPVPWRAIFQPAEEITQGAHEMVAFGAMRDVGAIVALHVDPEARAGQVGVRYGHLTAASESLHVVIQGRGGHAARPHHTDDPIAVATQFVSAIYQFVPRAVDIRHPVVVSFGMIQGGSNANVIPEIVRLQGTLRTLGNEFAEPVRRRIRAMARGLADASGARIDIQFKRGADAVINDTCVTHVCAQAAAAVVSNDNIYAINLPSMGAEDFSAYLAHAPGCMLRLGVAGAGTQHFLHSPLFDIDERAIAIGAKVFARSAVLAAQNAEDAMRR